MHEGIVLFQDGGHQNIVFSDLAGGLAVQANQHLLIHDGAGMLLDPGGHKVYARMSAAVEERCERLDAIVLSHQDPDIVAGLNGWLLMTPANAYVPKLWTRFIPHFGLDTLVESRLLAVPDEGMWLDHNGSEVCLLPAHFLHSCGNLQVYDPIARILYSGDLGASVGSTDVEVDDFDRHVPHMEAFHRRYMGGSAILRAWAEMASALEIDMIAPQHGAVFSGPKLVRQFIEWVSELKCGPDLWLDRLRPPPRPTSMVKTAVEPRRGSRWARSD